MEATRLAQSALNDRLDFMGIDDTVTEALRRARPSVESAIGPALDRFYVKVRKSPELRRFFRDEEHMDRARDMQEQHWQRILEGEFGEDYCQTVRNVGEAHARIGLDPRWYIGAYALVLEGLLGTVGDDSVRSGLRWTKGLGGKNAGGQVVALVKAALLDIELSISTYLDRLETLREEALESHETALDALTEAFESLSNGDLAASVNDDIAAGNPRMANALNAATSSLQSVISEMKRASAGIQSGSSEVAQASDDLAQRTEQQAASLEETSAAIASLTEVVRSTSELARNTSDTVEAALKDAKSGSSVVQETESAMSQIADSSQEMSQIIGVIDEIAFQTNLLALNAGVEAARAGDAGRGFAVVASEVRTLAQRSADAAQTIKTLIGSSTQNVENGVELVEKTSSVLARVVEAFGSVGSQIESIAGAAEGQTGSISEINSAISYLDQMTQQNAAMVEETSAASTSLATEAQGLSTIVGRFNLQN